MAAPEGATTTRAPVAQSTHGPLKLIGDALGDVPLTASQRAAIEKLAADTEARHAESRARRARTSRSPSRRRCRQAPSIAPRSSRRSTRSSPTLQAGAAGGPRGVRAAPRHPHARPAHRVRRRHRGADRPSAWDSCTSKHGAQAVGGGPRPLRRPEVADQGRDASAVAGRRGRARRPRRPGPSRRSTARR